MQIAMVGLGRMGAGMVRRLLADGHKCVVFDSEISAIDALVKSGAIGATSLEDLTTKLNFGNKLLSAMRHSFGGHAEVPVAKTP